MQLDIKDKFELMRDAAEHNAMFTNPEGVQQVRDARENSFKTDDDDFDNLLEETFGRSVSDKKQVNEIDVLQILTEDREKEKLSSVIEMDLDEVKFTPF